MSDRRDPEELEAQESAEGARIDLEEATERAYAEGSRQAWLRVLQTALRELGEDGDPARWVLERQEAIATLRRICEDHGDNEWEDNLHLADVIEKHLGRHL